MGISPTECRPAIEWHGLLQQFPALEYHSVRFTPTIRPEHRVESPDLLRKDRFVLGRAWKSAEIDVPPLDAFEVDVVNRREDIQAHSPHLLAILSRNIILEPTGRMEGRIVRRDPPFAEAHDVEI